MADQMKPIFEIDYQKLVVWIVILMSAMWGLKTLIGNILDWLGVETKWMRERREQKALIVRASTEIEHLQEEHVKDFRQMGEHMEKIAGQIDQLSKDQVARNVRRDEILAMQIRRDLVESCERALRDDQITLRNLQAIEDLYRVYHDPAYLGQNSYVSDLVAKARKLKVVSETEGERERSPFAG